MTTMFPKQIIMMPNMIQTLPFSCLVLCQLVPFPAKLLK